jgi:transposase
MSAKRYELSQLQWERIAPLLPGKAGDPGRTAGDNRLFVNGVLWVLRSGAHWCDLPERMAGGRRPTNASADGRRRVSGTGSLPI